MRIVLIHYSAPPTIGGVESVIRHHALQMANAGHQVCIIAGTGQVFDRRIQFVPIPLISSRHTSILEAKRSLDQGTVPAEFGPLVREIKRRILSSFGSADWLIAHNVCSLHKNLPLTAALHELSQQPGFPKMILWHHDMAWTSSRYKGELHSGYPWELLRTAWPGIRQVTISEMRRGEVAALQQISQEKITVVPNGIEPVSIYKLGSTTRKIVNQLNLLKALPLFLLPVRITRRKNIELAIRVVSFLQSDFPAIKLLITGPLGAHNPENSRYFEGLKGLREELKLTDSVIFMAEANHDPYPDEVVFDLYRFADALLIPSWEEGFGIPILEAGLIGLPIFSSAIPSLEELGGKEIQTFAPDGDPNQIAELIRRSLANVQTIRLKTRVKQSYSWSEIYQARIAPLLVGM